MSLSEFDLKFSSPASLTKKIEANRRFHKYQRMLNRIRRKIFDYEDEGKLDKAHRVIQKIKAICDPWWRKAASEAADRRLNPQIYK